MLICVDGTGTAKGTIADLLFHTKNRGANFAMEMMGSFVGMVYYGSHLPNRRYYQGPDWSGTGPNFIWPYNLYQQIREFWRQGDHQIFMTGYSRGAAIVINTAAILNDKRNPMPDGQYAQVEAMFLFDAVARSFELPRAQSIPSNVKYCYHAMRKESAHSRWTFGHCGKGKEGGNTVLVPNEFYTTHGGMGGTPWGVEGLVDPETYRKNPHGPLPVYIDEGGLDGMTKVTVEQEKAGSEAVHDWMWPFLRKHRVL